MKLNLGCQIHAFEGWTNQDIIGDDPNIKADLVCDAAKLDTIPSDSVDFIYAGHLVEHYYPDTLPAALIEWRRVLKPGGQLAIITPDCGEVFKDYASGKLTMQHTWQQLYGRIYHYDSAPERHHIAFDFDTLYHFAHQISWERSEAFNFSAPPEELLPFMDTHISRAPYQTGIILTK